MVWALGWAERDFFEFGFDQFRDYKDVEVIVCHVFGDIPGSIEDGAKDFALETGCVGCWLAWLNPITRLHKSDWA